MTHNDNTYSLSTIFQYEAITRQHCISEGGVELTTQELIELTAKEDEFNINYANYLIFKRLHLISDYITQKALNTWGITINVKDNQKLNDNINEDYYESWIEFYSTKAFSDYPDIYEIIDQAIKGKNWDVLYYIYYKKRMNLPISLLKKKTNLTRKKKKKA